MGLDADAQRHLERDRAVVANALAGRLTAAYQPIVDLGRGVVVGYEALLRYRSDADANPFSATQLLSAAERVGRSGEVEAAALRAAMLARDDLPRECFLSLNVSLGALGDERVTDVLRNEGNLDGVVLELQGCDEHTIAGARDALDVCRDRGAVIAVTDPLMQPSWIESLLLLEPGFLKLGGGLVVGVSESNTKLAVVDSVRHLAERVGIGVIAQGIEDLADLRSLERIGVGFGQGYLLARPSLDRPRTTVLPPMAGQAGGRTPFSSLGPLIEAVCELTEAELDQPIPSGRGGIEYEVLVTDLREPLALLHRAGRRVESLTLTVVEESAGLHHAARVATRRPLGTRFEPLVCVDEFGACAGVIRIDRLIDALAGVPPVVDPIASPSGDGHRSRYALDFSCRPRHRPRPR